MNIPGTDFPFPVIERKGPPVLHSTGETKQRRGLLAKIHIAKHQMRLNDGEYEMVLRSFHVVSAADMTIVQLEHCVKLLKSYGWKSGRTQTPDQGARVTALRARCVEMSGRIPNGEKRLAGLALKICGTSQLVWCRDIARLERLLAVLGKILDEEEAKHEN